MNSECAPIQQFNDNNNQINQNNEQNNFLTVGNNQNNENIDQFSYNDRFKYDIIDGDKCIICFTQFKNSDIIKKLQCGHIYHKFCLETFSKNQIGNQPLCLICLQWQLQDQIHKK